MQALQQVRAAVRKAMQLGGCCSLPSRATIRREFTSQREGAPGGLDRASGFLYPL